MSGSRLITAMPVLVFALLAFTALASEKVTISTGEVIILSDDGTWNYEIRPLQRNKVVKTNRSGFKKSDNCYYPVDRNFNGYNLWIAPARWQHARDPLVQPPNGLVE